MLDNGLIGHMIWTLRGAYKKTHAPIWKRLEEVLLGPKSNKREVDIGRLSYTTKDGDVVVVPGKVLGTGVIGHKLTVCAFSFSDNAAKKIINSGGKVVMMDEFVKAYPEGRGVRIIG